MPAKLASALSSPVPLERTATGPPPSPRYCAVIASCRPPGSGAAAMRRRTRAVERATSALSPAGSRARPARRAPSGSSARSTSAKALVVTTKPGGTVIPALASSPRPAALPPVTGRSPTPMSASVRVKSGLVIVPPWLSAQDPHDPAVTVDADPLAGLDHPGRVPGPHHGRHAVLARHDRRVRHVPADVGNRRLDLPEHRGPARRRDRADEELAVAALPDVVDAADHPRHALG